eukprot:gnl/TRDRNA2_/TRDRNA2_154789_c1_seq2.p1 gnl/TRDRNA2_/TRDRNA2_154789_c1~~gnl/TRDRNA2_/TRDRNA2_154789_c1_seq2.p1  ORF type:complete len:172 (+),score=19.80 gnl/TRDRNA2_/TRDRNA2_154789_c1_seq2:44-517(+)
MEPTESASSSLPQRRFSDAFLNALTHLAHVYERDVTALHAEISTLRGRQRCTSSLRDEKKVDSLVEASNSDTPAEDEPDASGHDRLEEAPATEGCDRVTLEQIRALAQLRQQDYLPAERARTDLKPLALPNPARRREVTEEFEEDFSKLLARSSVCR